MNHSYVCHESSIRVTWLIQIHDSFKSMTHSNECHDSPICGTWIIHVCDMTHSNDCHDISICGTWIIHMCDMTRVYTRWSARSDDARNQTQKWHDSSICVTWLIYMCDMTHSKECHDSAICGTWLIRVCAQTRLYTRWSARSDDAPDQTQKCREGAYPVRGLLPHSFFFWAVQTNQWLLICCHIWNVLSSWALAIFLEYPSKILMSVTVFM